jgi:hypothetical protein
MAGWVVERTRYRTASRGLWKSLMTSFVGQRREGTNLMWQQLDRSDEARTDDEVYLMIYWREVDHRRPRNEIRIGPFRTGLMV